MNFKNISDHIFGNTTKPYIPLIRIFLILISFKELLLIASKQEGYFNKSNKFYRSDFISDFAFDIFSQNNQLFLTVSIVFGVLSIFGLFTRISVSVYAFFIFLRYYLENSYGIYNHEAGLTIQLIILLSFSPGVTNWSLDTLIKNRFNLTNAVKLKEYSSWSIKLIYILIVTGYVTAGVSKIKYGGVDWLDGKTLQFYLSGKASFKGNPNQKFIPLTNDSDWKGELALKAYTYGNFQDNPQLANIAKSISSSTNLMSTFSILTVLLELSAIFILFSPHFRNIFLIAAICFHFSIRMLMGLGFLDYQVICLCLINWKLLSNQLTWVLPRRSI